MVSEFFWKKHAVQWEADRYSSAYSSLIYSSLKNRMNYLKFIVEQLPRSAQVMEVGCGSGLLFNLLENKNDIIYIGVDISTPAIERARSLNKNFTNATWRNESVEQLTEKKVDIVITAGLLDWLTDDEIKKIQIINSEYFIHSFSLSQNSYRIFLHNIFCKMISLFKKNTYKPRKFTLTEIESFFKGTKTNIIKHPDLSFGAFICKLPPYVETDFSIFKSKQYFKTKKKMGFVENLLKKIELSSIKTTLDIKMVKNVLEVGSGAGFYSNWFLSHGISSLTCVDSNIDTEKFINDKRARFFYDKFEKLQLNEKFNLIAVFGVLEFVQDTNIFLDNIFRHISFNGQVVFLTPKKNILNKLFYESFHKLKSSDLNPDVAIKLTEYISERKFNANCIRIDASPISELFIIKFNE